MIWFWAAFILMVALIGGCAVAFGSGAAGVNVDRKIEVASDNDIEKPKPVDKIKGK